MVSLSKVVSAMDALEEAASPNSISRPLLCHDE